MSRRRTTAALLAAALTVLVAPHALPAQAAGTHDRAAAPSRVVAHPLIQGVVVDQDGDPVDDVEVQATKDDGTEQASALTYASDRPDGPQHGYFFLDVTKGTFTLTLAKDGYRTVEYDAGTITRRGQRISMGELEIVKIAPRTTTSASLQDATVTTRQRGLVDVLVSSHAGRPTGEVEVREDGDVVGDATVARSDHGKVTVTLDRLGRGDHDLRAFFLGSSSWKGSSSKVITLHVVKKRH